MPPEKKFSCTRVMQFISHKNQVKQNQQAWQSSATNLKICLLSLLACQGKIPKTLVQIFQESPLNEFDILKIK